jgi:hypothetical protein
MRRRSKINIILILFTIIQNITTNTCNSQMERIFNDSINKKIEVRINPYFYISANPNPFKDIVNFKLYGLFTVFDKEIEFKIFNIYGKEVVNLPENASQNNNGETSEFSSSLGYLPYGVYLPRLFSDGYLIVKKFVKY